MDLFSMDFLGLKLAGLAFHILGGLWVYGKFFAGKTSVDLLAAFKADLVKVETLIAAKAKEAEAKAADIVKAQTTKEALDADVQKLRDFSDKVKQLF